MKITFAIFGGFVLGASLTIVVTASPKFAPWYSQVIYDCGIRIAATGVSGGTIRNFYIYGHDYGVCQDGGSYITTNDTPAR